MQRLHIDDLSGNLLLEGSNAWSLLKLPAIAESDETFEVKRFDGRVFRHVFKEGDLLHPARLSQRTLDSIRNDVGSYLFAAQYQQNPALPGGNLVKLEWFSRYAEPPATFDSVLQSWDTASKAGELNDYSVLTTWGCKGEHIYLLDVLRAKYEFPDLKRVAIEQRERYRPHFILVEDAGSGIALQQELNRARIYSVKAIKPDKDKVLRMRAQTGLIESGRVHLPKEARWLAAYETELMLFPNARHDDQVDSTSQALGYFQELPTSIGLLLYYREQNERRLRGEDV